MPWNHAPTFQGHPSMTVHSGISTSWMAPLLLLEILAPPHRGQSGWRRASLSAAELLLGDRIKCCLTKIAAKFLRWSAGFCRRWAAAFRPL